MHSVDRALLFVLVFAYYSFFFESFCFVVDVVDVVVVRGCGFAIDFKQVELLLSHISCIC